MIIWYEFIIRNLSTYPILKKRAIWRCKYMSYFTLNVWIYEGLNTWFCWKSILQKKKKRTRNIQVFPWLDLPAFLLLPFHQKIFASSSLSVVCPTACLLSINYLHFNFVILNTWTILSRNIALYMDCSFNIPSCQTKDYGIGT
jgi:hypothetical protein